MAFASSNELILQFSQPRSDSAQKAKHVNTYILRSVHNRCCACQRDEDILEYLRIKSPQDLAPPMALLEDW